MSFCLNGSRTQPSVVPPVAESWLSGVRKASMDNAEYEQRWRSASNRGRSFPHFVVLAAPPKRRQNATVSRIEQHRRRLPRSGCRDRRSCRSRDPSKTRFNFVFRNSQNPFLVPQSAKNGSSCCAVHRSRQNTGDVLSPINHNRFPDRTRGYRVHDRRTD